MTRRVPASPPLGRSNREGFAGPVDRYRFVDGRRFDRSRNERDRAEVVPAGGLRLAARPHGVRKLGQGARRPGPGHGGQRRRARLAPARPDHHPVVAHVVVAARPDDLTALELEVPLAGPRGAGARRVTQLPR